jgi:hypothetical protein
MSIITIMGGTTAGIMENTRNGITAVEDTTIETIAIGNYDW